MILYRAFNWLKSAKEKEVGGVFWNPQSLQRTGPAGGRHDIPSKDGVLYCSLTPLSPIAEQLKGFSNRKIKPSVFKREKIYDLALVSFSTNKELNLIDLNEPDSLSRLKSKSSEVFTNHRETTQSMSEKIFDLGYDGILWPSVLESSWINASLYYSRALNKINIDKAPTGLNFKNEYVKQVSEKLVIELDN